MKQNINDPVNRVEDIYSLVILNKFRGRKGKTVLNISKETFEALKSQGASWRKVRRAVLAKEEFPYALETVVRQYLITYEIIADEGTRTNF